MALYSVYPEGAATPFDEAVPVILPRRSTCRRQQKALVAQGLKRCGRCNEIKPLSCFPESATHSAGRRNICGVCYSTYQNSWRRTRPEVVMAWQADWYARNAAQERENRQRYREANRALVRERDRQRRRADPTYRIKAKIHASARRVRLRGNGGRHTIAELDALCCAQESCCYYCSSPLGVSYARDHKQPVSRGGTDAIENIALCCSRCNQRKGNKTEEEFRAWLSARRLSLPAIQA